MDTTTLDALTRLITSASSRRTVLRGLAAGMATLSGVGLMRADEATARRMRNQSKKKKHKNNPPQANVCAEMNWCVDRTQTCGQTGGNGKCLVEATGGNLCAEILFQTNTCADCEAPGCTICKCVLAADGGDRCNNGATGDDFICVRAV